MNFLTALTIGLQYAVNGRTMLCAVPVLIKNHITAAGTYVNRGNDSLLNCRHSATITDNIKLSHRTGMVQVSSRTAVPYLSHRTGMVQLSC